jgi:hypothetical protein
VRLIWTPPEGEPKEYEFKPWEQLSPDAEDIELVGGEAWTTYDEFVPLFTRGHRRAMRAELWIARRRAGEDRLRFGDLVLRAGRELRMTQDEEELAQLREIVRADMSLPDDVRSALLEAYGDDGTDVTGEADPKAQPNVPPPTHPVTASGDAASDG